MTYTKAGGAMAAMTELTQDVSDETLMALIQDRNDDALAMLYDRHHRGAFSLAYRIVNDFGQAEDVVQEAFLAVWRHAGSYLATRGRPRAWLMTIVHHRAINQLRGRLAPGQIAELDEGLLDYEQPEVWQVAYEGIRGDDIREALSQLPSEQREAIELAFFGGLSHSEIAERQGLPLGTVKSRIRLAFTKLQTFLNGYAMEHAR
jgi:RNA polymerase sigma-70 factor (ECF subfamily)